MGALSPNPEGDGKCGLWAVSFREQNICIQIFELLVFELCSWADSGSGAPRPGPKKKAGRVGRLESQSMQSAIRKKIVN